MRLAVFACNIRWLGYCIHVFGRQVFCFRIVSLERPAFGLRSLLFCFPRLRPPVYFLLVCWPFCHGNSISPRNVYWIWLMFAGAGFGWDFHLFFIVVSWLKDWGIVSCLNWLYCCCRHRNVFNSFRVASSLLLFISSCCFGIGSLRNRNVCYKCASLSWKVVSLLLSGNAGSPRMSLSSAHLSLDPNGSGLLPSGLSLWSTCGALQGYR